MRYLQAEVISVGKSAEARLAHWQQVQEWYQSPMGKAYQAYMQKEYERLHVAVLTCEDQAKQALLVQQMKQQNFVISFGKVISDKVKGYYSKTQESAAA